MLSLMKKLRRILHRNRFKTTGKIVEILNTPFVWVGDKLSTFIGACERAKEVVLFIPVIYGAVRWDYSSIWKILHHWLSRMEDCHRKDTLHSRADKNARNLKEAVLLLKRLKDWEYENIAFLEHDKRWGELTLRFFPSDKPGYSEIKSNRPNVLTPEDKVLERKEFQVCYKHADYLEKQDIARLFTIIKKHYGKWWV